MKFEKDEKTGKIKGELDIEQVMMKKIELHEKNWKDKFTTKHNAKKEMLTLKRHLKNDDMMKEMLEEEKREKEKQREEIAKKEEERKKMQKMQVLLSILLAVSGTALIAVGYAFGSSVGEGRSPWDVLLLVGLALLICIRFVWKIKS